MPLTTGPRGRSHSPASPPLQSQPQPRVRADGNTHIPLTWDALESRRPLPMRFLLLASKRTSRALCPCLAVWINGIRILRILDPEHREPFITLGGIFAAAGLTPIEGLLRFDLHRGRGHFDVSLAGLEPRDELWAPLTLARQIASELGLLEVLASLLDWGSRHAWSLDEGEGGLIHNWRIPARILDSSVYSTAALLDTSIPFLELLPSGQQVRTLVSSEQRGLRNSQRAGRWSTTQEASSSSAEEAPEGSLAHVHHLDENTARMKENAAERVDEVLLRWSVQVWEAYVEALDEEAALGVTIPDSSVRLSSPPVRASMNEAHLDVPPALGPLLSLLLDMLTSVGTSLSGSASDRATLRGSGKHVDTLMLCGGKLRISAEELASASWRTTQPEGHGEAHRVPHQPRGSKSTRYGLDHDGARVELDLPNQDGQGTLSDLSPQIVPGPESTQARLRFALVHLLSRCAVTQRNINPIFVNWVEPSMPSEPELGAWSNIAGGNGSESVTGRFHQLQTRMEKLERATERLERGMTILLERLTAPPPPAPPHPPPTSAQQGTFGTGTKQRSTATSPTSPRAQMVPVSPTQTRTQGQGQDDWSRPAPQARHRRSGSSETPDLGTEPSQIQTHSGNASSKGPSSKPNKSSSASSPIAAALPTNGGTAAPSAAVAAAIPKTTTATTTTSEAVQRARALDESRNTRDWLEDRLPGPAAALPLMVFFAVGLVLWRLVPGLFPI